MISQVDIVLTECQEKGSGEVRLAGVIVTTSPFEHCLVLNKYGTSPYAHYFCYTEIVFHLVRVGGWQVAHHAMHGTTNSMNNYIHRY